MPMKPRKTYKKKKPKKHFQVRKGAPSQLIYYDNKRLNPYPRRYITKIQSSLYGGYPPPLNAGIFNLNVLSKTPFFNNTFTQNTKPPPATLTGTGFTNLCNSNFYRYYRVTGFKVTIEFIPQALTDTVICALTPSTIAGLPATTDAALTQPFTKKGNFSSSKNNTNSKRGNSITLSMKTHDFFGVNKLVFDNDMTGNFAALYNGTPLRPIFVVVNFNTIDSVNTATPMEFRIDVVQYIEFYEQDTANLTTT